MCIENSGEKRKAKKKENERKQQLIRR